MTFNQFTNKPRPVSDMVDDMMEHFKQLSVEAGEPYKSIAEEKAKLRANLRSKK